MNTITRAAEVQQSMEERIYRACQYSVDEICLAYATMEGHRDRLKIEIDRLVKAYADRDMPAIKAACDAACTAAANLEKSNVQLRELSKTMGGVFAIHISRKEYSV